MKSCHRLHDAVFPVVMKHVASHRPKVAEEEILPLLVWASKRGYIRVVKGLLDNGADIKTTALQNGLVWTALLCACYGGEIVLVELLLTYGADPNFADSNRGVTPLNIASTRGIYPL
jgi:ankyrin repeat protein